MSVQKQISEYIAAQPEPKYSEMQELHGMILTLMPACKLWFLDGKDEKGKIVSNPNIGYGTQTMEYANGKPGSSIKSGSVPIQQAFPSTLWD